MLEDAFIEYVSNYNLDNPDIKLKYNHSFRVMKLQEKYAKLLGWNEEDVELARIIGLLHDIGRFEQLKVYNTYDDSISIDHANYSCTQLFEKGEIKKFVSNEDWYPIIDFAIKNHNKKILEVVSDERMMKHAKLIRDTDKIDIIFLVGTLEELDVKPVEDKITKRVFDDFYAHKSIDNKAIVNRNDYYVGQYAFVYDVNYAVCLKELGKNFANYANKQKDNEQLMKVYDEILKYIKERLENEGIR